MRRQKMVSFPTSPIYTVSQKNAPTLKRYSSEL